MYIKKIINVHLICIFVDKYIEYFHIKCGFACTCTLFPEDEDRLSDLSRSLKEEKHGRKSAENNITQLQEELADLKATKFSLEKVSIKFVNWFSVFVF